MPSERERMEPVPTQVESDVQKELACWKRLYNEQGKLLMALTAREKRLSEALRLVASQARDPNLKAEILVAAMRKTAMDALAELTPPTRGKDDADANRE